MRWQQPLRRCRDDIISNPASLFHELLSQPTCNTANDNGCDPTNCWSSMALLPRRGCRPVHPCRNSPACQDTKQAPVTIVPSDLAHPYTALQVCRSQSTRQRLPLDELKCELMIAAIAQIFSPKRAKREFVSHLAASAAPVGSRAGERTGAARRLAPEAAESSRREVRVGP